MMGEKSHFREHLNLNMAFLKAQRLQFIGEYAVLLLVSGLVSWGLFGFSFASMSFFQEPLMGSIPIFSSLTLGTVALVTLFSTCLLNGWVTLSYTQKQMGLIDKIKALPLVTYLFYSVLISFLGSVSTGLIMGRSLGEAVPLIRLLSNLGESSSAFGSTLALVGLVFLSSFLFLALLMALPRITLREKGTWQLLNSQKVTVFSFCVLSLVSYLLFVFLLSLLNHFVLALVTEVVIGGGLFIFLSALWTQIHYPDLAPEVKPVSPGNIPLLLSACLGIALFFIADMANQKSLESYQDEYSKTIETITNSSKHRKALSGETFKGNARELYQSLILKPVSKEHSIDPKDIKKIYISKSKNSKENLFRSVHEFKYDADTLAKYDVLLKEFSQAVRSSTLTPLQDEFSIDALLPDYINAQSLMKLMVARAVHEIEEGDDQGFNSFLDTLRFGQDLRWKSFLISDMVAVVIQKETVLNYLKQAAPTQMSGMRAKSLLVQWQTLLNDQEILADTYSLEGLMWVGSFSQNPDMLWGSDLSDSPLTGLGSKFALPYMLYTLRLSEQLYSKMNEVYTLPPYRSYTKKEELSKLIEELAGKNALLAVAMPNFSGASERVWQNQVRLDMAYLKTALIAYYHSHKTYPKSLSELVPEVIPHLPKDPYSGKDYSYNLGEHSYVLKSEKDKKLSYKVSF